MQEEFDNKFGQRVKEVFEKREVTYNPEDWEKLLVKKSERKKGFLIWPLGKSAAVIMLFLLLGGTGALFLYNTYQSPGTKIESDTQEIIVKSDPEDGQEKNDTQPGALDSINDPANEAIKQKTEIKFEEIEEGIAKEDILQEPNLEKTQKTQVEESLKVEEAIVQSKPIEQTIQKGRDVLVRDIFQKDSTQLAPQKSMLAEKQLDTTTIIPMDPTEKPIEKIAINEPENSIDSLETLDELLALETIDEIEKAKKELTFGVVLAPMVNQDQADQNNNVNVGGGVMVEIPVANNFDIYTGLLVANQRVNIQDNTLQELSSGTQLKSKNAALTGLDIPLNVKYNFKMNKNKMFVSIGLSSLTYFKENVESIYQVSSTVLSSAITDSGTEVLVSETTNVLETEIDAKGSFNKFHFGRIINFSYGIEIPIKNFRQSIIVEPYYKHSLESSSSENLIFSSAGLNLKLNFNPKGKSK
jgi:hypothetical protein